MCETCGPCLKQYYIQNECHSNDPLPGGSQCRYFLTPLSDRRSFAGLRMTKNLLRALIKLSVNRASISSICTALVDIDVKSMAQLFAAPLVRCVVMDHGPNTSRPTQVNAGSGLSLLTESVSWQICHFLVLQLPSGFFCQANHPVSSCSDGSFRNVLYLLSY